MKKMCLVNIITIGKKFERNCFGNAITEQSLPLEPLATVNNRQADIQIYSQLANRPMQTKIIVKQLISYYLTNTVELEQDFTTKQ